MDEALYDEMYRLESRHWWFCAKRRIVLSLLKAFLPIGRGGTGPVRVCDIGCGCGMMLRSLAEAGYEATGVDASETAVEHCRRRGVSATCGSLPHEIGLPDGSFDAALLLDVLEHVEDDRAAVRAAVRTLRPGGVLVCTVPAYPWLWTKRDEFHQHNRRYTRSGLRAVLESVSQGRLRSLSYMNTLLFPLALVARGLGKAIPIRRRPTDLHVPPFGINAILERTFAAEGALLARGLSLPYGLSVVAVLQGGHADGERLAAATTKARRSAGGTA